MFRYFPDNMMWSQAVLIALNLGKRFKFIGFPLHIRGGTGSGRRRA